MCQWGNYSSWFVICLFTLLINPLDTMGISLN